MNNVYSIGLSIIFSVFISLPVYAEGIPELKNVNPLFCAHQRDGGS
jgi:hypothetical protein